MEVLPSYSAAWARYRRGKNLFIASMVGVVPAFMLIGCWLSNVIGSETPLYAAAFLTMAYVVLGAVVHTYWRCPRCGKSFHLNGSYGNAIAQRCLHCGLPKWSGTDPTPHP